jgi:hypothetical protein
MTFLAVGLAFSAIMGVGVEMISIPTGGAVAVIST